MLLSSTHSFFLHIHCYCSLARQPTYSAKKPLALYQSGSGPLCSDYERPESGRPISEETGWWGRKGEGARDDDVKRLRYVVLLSLLAHSQLVTPAMAEAKEAIQAVLRTFPNIKDLKPEQEDSLINFISCKGHVIARSGRITYVMSNCRRLGDSCPIISNQN